MTHVLDARATCKSTQDTLPINEVELVELPLDIRRYAIYMTHRVHRVRDCYRATCTSMQDTLPINVDELVESPLDSRRTRHL